MRSDPLRLLAEITRIGVAVLRMIAPWLWITPFGSALLPEV